jgi:hypothetical protein
MTDELTIIVSLLPTLFSILVAAMGSRGDSKGFDYTNFIEPAIRPGKSVAGDLHKSHHCPSTAVEPFVALSVARVQLSSFLFFLSVSLLSSLGFLVARLAAGVVEITSVFSFLFYFVGLIILNFYFVIGQRDIFQWWRRPITRIPVIAAVGAITTIAGLRADVVDLLGYLVDAQRSYVVAGYYVARIWILTVVLGPFVVFLISRAWVSRKHPGLRQLVMGHMDKDPAGHTLSEWFKLLNPLGKGYPTEEDVKQHIEELVYQGVATLTLQSPDADPVYKKA